MIFKPLAKTNYLRQASTDSEMNNIHPWKRGCLGKLRKLTLNVLVGLFGAIYRRRVYSWKEARVTLVTNDGPSIWTSPFDGNEVLYPIALNAQSDIGATA